MKIKWGRYIPYQTDRQHQCEGLPNADQGWDGVQGAKLWNMLEERLRAEPKLDIVKTIVENLLPSAIFWMRGQTSMKHEHLKSFFTILCHLL